MAKQAKLPQESNAVARLSAANHGVIGTILHRESGLFTQKAAVNHNAENSDLIFPRLRAF